MDTPTSGISPLRQRMIDDMRMRQFSPKTQSAFIRAVRHFTKYLGRAPDGASVEELRNYQLHLVDAGTSPILLNAAISGLKFFFDIKKVDIRLFQALLGHRRLDATVIYTVR